MHFTTANCRHLIRFSLQKILSLLSYPNPWYFLGKIMYSMLHNRAVVLQLNHPSIISILSAVEAKVFRESVMRDIFRPTRSTDCFLRYDIIENGVKKWKKCNKFYWIWFRGNIFTKICWCCSTSGAFPELLICFDILNAKFHHMIQIFVIVFLAVLIISAESSRLFLFTVIYMFIRMRYFL